MLTVIKLFMMENQVIGKLLLCIQTSEAEEMHINFIVN